MGIGLDGQKDIPLCAIAALVRGAVLAELGEDVLASIFSDPRSLQVLRAASLPALCVYRKSRKSRRESSTQRVQDIVVGFDYMLPATNADQRDLRWATLDAVWDVIETAVLDGKHSSVGDGAEVLVAAATQGREGTAQCRNGLADGGGENYPIFIGEITVTYSPAEVDADSIDDFLRMHAAYDEFPNPDPAPAQDDPETTTDDVEIPQE